MLHVSHHCVMDKVSISFVLFRLGRGAQQQLKFGCRNVGSILGAEVATGGYVKTVGQNHSNDYHYGILSYFVRLRQRLGHVVDVNEGM